MNHPAPLRRWIPFFAASLVGLFTSALPIEAQDCTMTTAPTVRTVNQPDGSKVRLFFRGNGLEHWYEDTDGFSVVRTGAGYFYARRGPDGGLKATQARVGASDPRLHEIEQGYVPASAKARTHRSATRKHRKASGSGGGGSRGAFFTAAGSVKNLVILLRFSDHGPGGQDRILPSAADISTIMNAVGGDATLAPTGSVRDHYLENSYDAFTIDSTVVGWVDLPNTETFYADGSSGLTSLTWDLITAGLDAVDASVDFSDFDEDGDGFVDAITFLHSGYGAEFGGDDSYGTNYVDRMWSHKWGIPTWTSAEGVKVGDYNISPGLWDTAGSEAGHIGVVVHELGHFFGMPDLYDTNGGGQGLGDWDVMGSGAWGFDGTQQYPTHMSGWSKMKLGWISPQLLLPGAHSAAQIETNAELFMIDSGYPSGEYLLIENRQQVGFDSVIPQGGLAVWHVDEGKDSFTLNSPNTDEGYPGQSGWPENDNHYRVALLQADGAYDIEQGVNRGDSGDLYHSGGTATIDTGTTPNTDGYQDGTILANQNRLQDIGASGPSVSFTYVNAAAPVVMPASLSTDAWVGLPYTNIFGNTGGTAPFTWFEYIENPDYVLTDLGPQPFVGGGVAQGFNADEGTWAVDLPFLFPYYDTSYSSVYVTPNGTVDLAPLKVEFYNTPLFLRAFPRIAGLWDNLVTNAAGGQDIYVTSSSESVRFRWEAEPWGSGLPANFAITLNKDGRIRFDYGGGNTDLSPTVGISRGHSGACTLVATHDTQSTLTDANSVEFQLTGSQLPPGLSLSSSGVLSGTPTTAGLYEFIVRVTDSGHRYHQMLTSVEVHVLTAAPAMGPTLKGNPVPQSVKLPPR